MGFSAAAQEYLVVWQDRRSYSDYDVYARRLAAQGDLLGPEIFISAASSDQRNPAVAWNSHDNQYLLTWDDLRSGLSYDIYGLILPGAYTPSAVASLTARAEDGNLVLTWNHADGAIHHYEVWRSASTPYALPGSSGTMKIATLNPEPGNPTMTFTDRESGLGNDGVDMFYTVVGVTASGAQTPPSRIIGEMDFAIQAGD